jgi:hypothetical protein
VNAMQGPILPGERHLRPLDPIVSTLVVELGRSEQRTLRLARAVMALTDDRDDLHCSARDLVRALEP